MPTIEISLHDLNNLVGKHFTEKELEKALEYVKGEIEDRDGDRLKIEIADTNRPDLWSIEGIARELRSRFGKEKGIPKYEIKKPSMKVIVDKNLEGIRPKTVCAVVRGLNITEEVLFQMIQLQEKVCETFGRKRKEVALGVYDYHKIKPPIYYKAYKPRDIKFVPLEFSEEMHLDEILQRHPKGKEYAHLLKGKKMYPIFMDSSGQVLSMPPIINSDYTGKVTTETKDVFIECSGFDLKYLIPALNIMVSALADRGGKIESVEVVYPDGKIVTPDLTPKKIEIDVNYLKSLTGLDLSLAKIKDLLEKSRYDVIVKKEKIAVCHPAYRQDVMHQVDVIEDLIITYGYNNIEPIIPKISSKGELTEINNFVKKVTEIMIGLGGQEIMSYTLTNKDDLLIKMNLNENEMKVIEVDSPVSKNWSVFRTWIIPNLIEFLGKNTHREYPQQIFEIGEVVVYDEKAETKARNPVRLAWALADKDANFTKAKQALNFIMRNLGLNYEIESIEHNSFINGRVGRISVNGKKVAYMGEIHPQVLENFGIEMPVCAFELNLSDLLELLKK
ncbi:MAG: phenylalanine--tRNA ligase subunit beta [Candidatus Aenigmarchaeota archaeon]|nr:phenylalanine--tRNA ligase subunit beta [Candidatus Aenigmarchaeota archaeon]